jgi:bacillithiol biosynthesis cysteine-adding enzyme BshC
MDPACIPHASIPGTSRLFADYCSDFARVARFYRHDPYSAEGLAAAAAEVDYPEDRRAAMARALAGQNPPSELLARFAQPGTVAVVTGQQAGLFGGPAYTLYKALTAARLAAELTARGAPAVPIFWIATEDHDFAEVSHTWVFDRERQPVELRMATPAGWEDGPRPAGNYPVENPPIEALRTALTGFPHAADVMRAVEEAYCPGATLGSAFRALLRRLLEGVGILTVDPLAAPVRSIGAPLLAEALRSAAELKAALLNRGAELIRAGYHAQVLVDGKSSLFFQLEGDERRALRLPDGEFAALAGRAETISPNALLRPVWQDYLFPTAAYVGGPGEVAYFAQSAVLFERLLGRMPAVYPRASFTLLDARAAKLLQRLKLNLTDLMTPEAALRERIARTLVPAALETAFAETADSITGRLDRLGAQLQQFDPTLAEALRRSRAKALYQIEKLRRKTEREALRRDTRASAEAAYLSGLLYPHGHLQERLHSPLPFLAAQGMDLVDRLYEDLRLDCRGHRVLTL